MAPPASDDIRVKSLKLRGNVIKVCVGTEPNQETFGVHEALICSRSEFFKRAMNGSWKESDEGIVNMPEDDPETLSKYMQLMYTGLLPCRSDEALSSSAEEYKHLAMLYVFGEKIQDLDLKNKATEGILRKTRKIGKDGLNHFPGSNSITIIYEETPGACSGEFLRDLAAALLNVRILTTENITLTCEMHAYNEKARSLKDKSKATGKPKR